MIVLNLNKILLFIVLSITIAIAKVGAHGVKWADDKLIISLAYIRQNNITQDHIHLSC